MRDENNRFHMNYLSKVLQKLPNHLPIAPGWKRFPAENPMQKFRRDCPIRSFSRFSETARVFLNAILFVYAPMRLLFLSVHFLGKFGTHVKTTQHKQMFLQFSEQLSLALFCGVHPREYYAYRLFLGEERKNAHNYYYLSDMGRSDPSQWGSGTREYAIVNDKKIFEGFCREKGFPHIPSLKTFGKLDTMEFAKVVGSLAEGSYVLKPCTGFRAEGVFFVDVENEELRINAGKPLPRMGGVKRLFQLAVKKGFLLQPRLVNHEGLRGLGSFLTTFRIITLLNKKGDGDLLAAVAQIPFHNQQASNHGLIAPVDDKGKLGYGRRLRLFSPFLDTHPDSHAAIRGLRVPFWRQAVEIAVKSHEALGAFASLGWDIAITPEGPILLEANSGWDPGMIQIAHGMPLGKTRLPEVLSHHCKRPCPSPLRTIN